MENIEVSDYMDPMWLMKSGVEASCLLKFIFLGNIVCTSENIKTVQRYTVKGKFPLPRQLSFLPRGKELPISRAGFFLHIAVNSY